MGRHNSTHVDEGRKSGKLLTIQMRGTNRRWVGGEKSLQCDPGSELRLGGRENKGEDNKWDGRRKKTKTKTKNVVVPLTASLTYYLGYSMEIEEYLMMAFSVVDQN